MSEKNFKWSFLFVQLEYKKDFFMRNYLNELYTNIQKEKNTEPWYYIRYLSLFVFRVSRFKLIFKLNLNNIPVIDSDTVATFSGQPPSSSVAKCLMTVRKTKGTPTLDIFLLGKMVVRNRIISNSYSVKVYEMYVI